MMDDAAILQKEKNKMEKDDEILAEEIKDTVNKLNKLVVKAVLSRNLKVDISYFPYQVFSVYEKTNLIECKIYKEIL
jgi:hypothetical protein